MKDPIYGPDYGDDEITTSVKRFVGKSVEVARDMGIVAFLLTKHSKRPHSVVHRFDGKGAILFSVHAADAVPEGWSVLHTVKEAA